MSKARDLADSAQEINILDGKSFLDEDNLASDSATGIASQQSIKAYVDGITTTNITSTGALNSGSITSGFGNIDNGSSTITTTGAISGGSFVIGSADINENDLESIDGITAGTVSASKAVVVNTNKDITGFRNITATGTISGSLSGTLSGAIASTTTATTQAESDDSTKVATTEYVSNKITTLIGGAPSTLNDLNELAAAINDDANYNSTLTTALATKLPKAGGTMTGDVLYNDNIKAKFGAGSDLQIYHNGGDSLIADTGTGDLYIRGSNNIFLQKGDGSETFIATADDSSVYLYHNNATKLSTTSTGIDVTGTALNLDGGGSNPLLTLKNSATYYSTVSHDTFNVQNNGLKLSTQGTERMRIDSSGNVLVGKTSNDIALNGVKLGTTGVNVTRSSNEVMVLNRTSSDGTILGLWKDGTPVGNIAVTGTNDLTLHSTATNHKGLRLGEGYYIPVNNAGSAEDNSVDIGVSTYRYKDLHLSGNISVGGTVDGRDVASDGSKLDGIATSANNYSHPTGNGNNHIPSGGSADQILKYSSAGTAQWADASGGTTVLLNRTVMNSTSSYDFTAMNSTLYDSYYVEFDGLQPSNGGASQLRVFVSTNSLSSVLSDTQGYGFRNTNGAAVGGYGQYGYMLIANSVGDAGYYGPNISGRFKIMNVNGAPDTSYVMNGQATYMNNSNQQDNCIFGAMHAQFTLSLPQINSFRMKFHAGTIVRGIIKTYGVLKA